MKTKAVTISTGNIHHPEAEELLQKGGITLNESAKKSAVFFSKKNQPFAKSDNILNYIGEIKTGFEKLASEIIHLIQPSEKVQDSKIEAVYYKEKDQKLEDEIEVKKTQNQIDEDKLGDFVHSAIPLRIKFVLISSLILFLGDVFFNTKSFQVIGENLLYAFFISLIISAVLFFLSHLLPFLYKRAKNKIQRILVLIGSLLLILGVFYAMASLRTNYLASHDVKVSPLYFIIFNTAIFITATLISFFVLPSYMEFKENLLKLKLSAEIKKRKKEIEQLKQEREIIKDTILEKTKMRIKIAHHTNYAMERIRKMYYESAEIFKMTNLKYRTDGTVPHCFSDPIPELDIQDFNYNIGLPAETE